MGKRKQIEREAPMEEEKDVEIQNMAFVGAVDEHSKKHDELDREYFDKMPPGFRFKPTGEDLIVHYLKNKVSNLPLPTNRIRDVNLYNFHPRQLSNMYKLHREREWYFFTPRDKKYPNGNRPDRSAGNGYWKATGADTKIFSNGVKVGTKKSLVYYEGKAKDKSGKKTEWLMHEYRVTTEEEDGSNNAAGPIRRAPNDMKLDDWVLCTMYKKDKPNEQDQGKEPNDVPEEENNEVIDEQVPNPKADHGVGVNNMVSVPLLNYEHVPSQNLVQETDFNFWANAQQVPGQNLVQETDFNFWANAPVVNEQVLNPTPIQGLHFNYGYTRFPPSHQATDMYNMNSSMYNQFDPLNTLLPYEPYLLYDQQEPVEILDYPPPLVKDFTEELPQDLDNGIWKKD